MNCMPRLWRFWPRRKWGLNRKDTRFVFAVFRLHGPLRDAGLSGQSLARRMAQKTSSGASSMIRVFIVSLVLALAACVSSPEATRVSLGSSVDIGAAGTQLSARRAGNGILRPLVHSPQLQAAAQAHAEDLQATGQFSHTGSDGSDIRARVQRARYNACFMAENIARGQPNVRSVVETWMGSPEHRRNILNAQVSQFGFANVGDIWVLVLARPCS